MPRVADVYEAPSNTTAVAGNTISSSQFESRIQSIETDLNTDRPVIAGGTGASTAANARTNLELGGKVNVAATAAPTANNDDTDGYSVGSVWIDTANDEIYVCADASVGAAVWRRIVFQNAPLLRINTTEDHEAVNINGNLSFSFAGNVINWNRYTVGATAYTVNAGYSGFATVNGSGDLIVGVSSTAATAGDETLTYRSIIQYDASEKRMFLRDTDNDSVADFRSNWTILPGVTQQTTASAANVNVAATGVIAEVTSSIQFKHEIEPADLAYSIAALDAEPIYYRSKSPLDPPEWSYWGFGAEQVAEIDPRLVHWRDGKPRAVQYERFVVHHNALIKDLYKRVEAAKPDHALIEPDAEERIAERDATIADLMKRLEAVESTIAAEFGSFDTMENSDE